MEQIHYQHFVLHMVCSNSNQHFYFIMYNLSYSSEAGNSRGGRGTNNVKSFYKVVWYSFSCQQLASERSIINGDDTSIE